MFGQEEDQDEAGRDSGAQREDHAVVSQHRGELTCNRATMVNRKRVELHTGVSKYLHVLPLG